MFAPIDQLTCFLSRARNATLFAFAVNRFSALPARPGPDRCLDSAGAVEHWCRGLRGVDATPLAGLRLRAANTMRVTLLARAPSLSLSGFGSAILVEAAGKRMLFDCGRGAVIRLAQAGVSPRGIDRLFFTHLHSDHIVGIPDLWLSGSATGSARIKLRHLAGRLL